MRQNQLTEEQLTPDLIDLILHSPDISDRVWALYRIDQSIELNPELTSSLLNMITGEDFFLAYSAINAIGSVHLNSDSFQSALFSKYEEVNFSIQRMIIEKFLEAPFLSQDVLETCQTIEKILQYENRYISQKAYEFLKGVDTSDPMILEILNAL